MSNDGTLPLEILTYILSRLPVKSLCRFKCVSPSWNSLISSPYFAKTHLNRTKTLKNPNQKILVMGGNLLYSVDFADTNPTAAKLNLPTAEQPPENWVHVYNSCDGLVLVSHRSGAGTELFLLNPSTGECKKLPLFPFVLDAANSFHTNLCGVGYDSSTDDYKVVMISPAWSQSSPRWAGVLTVAVYSLKTDSWRRIEDTNFFFVGSSGRVLVNGCLHGICRRDGSHVIVAFDLSNEVVREVPQPTSYIGSDVVLYHVAVLGGCLCLIDKQASEFWKMEEYGVRESWTKFKIPSRLFERSLFLLAEDEFLVNTSPGRQPKQLVVYNSQKDTMRNMVVCGILEFFIFECTYVESLISPHHGGGMGGNE